MSEIQREYKENGLPRTKRGRKVSGVESVQIPDDILLAMLEEVLAKLVLSGWAVIKLEKTARSGQSWILIAISGKDKPKIGLTSNSIITLNGIPVTEVLS